MLRDIFTNKWILGGISFLILFAGLCLFWYQHTTAQYREQSVDLDEIRQLDKQRTATTAKPTEPAADAPAGSTTPTAEKLINETTSVTDKIEPSKSQSDVPAEIAETKDVSVSPHGFGPYPKVPSGYPGGEDPNFWTYDWPKDVELMHRVAMKLWEEGKQVVGGTMSNGLVYPNYPNTLIVEWKTQKTLLGSRKVARKWQGSPETESFLQSHRGPLYESDIPSWIKVIERKDAGIDPYEFLDLP